MSDQAPDREQYKRILANAAILLDTGLFPGSTSEAVVEARGLIRALLADASEESK